MHVAYPFYASKFKMYVVLLINFFKIYEEL